MNENFFQRWAKRKHEARHAEEAEKGGKQDPAPEETTRRPLAPAGEKGLTLHDVTSLNADSDYSLFLAPGVDKAVRRAALKKLFSDPHFNQMDGLDIYIGDYTKSDPIPDAMRIALRHAERLFVPETQDEDDEQARAAGSRDESDHPDEDNLRVAGTDSNPFDASPVSPAVPADATKRTTIGKST